jgi:hypothetical protein
MGINYTKCRMWGKSEKNTNIQRQHEEDARNLKNFLKFCENYKGGEKR